MALEIERKFLVKGDFKQFVYKKEEIIQAYISENPERSVRIRRKAEKAFITIKGKSTNKGLSRFEWEKEISLPEANDLFQLCDSEKAINKTRYYIKSNNLIYEVDEFHGSNAGLIIAELELPEEEYSFEKPEWLGEEVTGDKKYYNSQLSECPYTKWKVENDRNQG